MRRIQVKNFFDDLLDTAKSSFQPLNPRRHSEKTRALLAVGLVSFFWGTTWLASKKVLNRRLLTVSCDPNHSEVCILFSCIEDSDVPAGASWFTLDVDHVCYAMIWHLVCTIYSQWIRCSYRCYCPYMDCPFQPDDF
jgi:hypothetical protein